MPGVAVQGAGEQRALERDVRDPGRLECGCDAQRRELHQRCGLPQRLCLGPDGIGERGRRARTRHLEDPAAEQRHQALGGELGQQRVPGDLPLQQLPRALRSPGAGPSCPRPAGRAPRAGAARAASQLGEARVVEVACRQQRAPAALDPRMSREGRRRPGGEHEPHVDAAASEHRQDDERPREAARVAREPLEDAHGGGGQAALVDVQRPAGRAPPPRRAQRRDGRRAGRGAGPTTAPAGR